MADRITSESVEGWVEGFGLRYHPHPLEDDTGYEWGLVVSGQAFQTIVAQRRAAFNYLAIQATVSVSEEHQAILRSLDEDERASFVYDLSLALHDQAIGHSVEFELDESGAQTKCPLRVTLGTNLTEEPIERADFLRGNHTVQTGATIVALIFQKMAHRRSWP